MTFKWIILLLALLGSAYSIVLEIVKYHSANNPTPDNVSVPTWSREKQTRF